MEHEKIDTANRFLVGVRADKLLIMNPPQGALTKSEALTFAAWIVALTDCELEEFKRHLDAVNAT